MPYIFYDFETSGRSARFDQILQAGFIIYDENFRELNKLNIKSRINSDTVPSINALRVNRLLISELLSEKLSYYEMTLKINSFLNQYSKSFYIGFNSINFDEEFLRQLFWEHFIYPYLTNTNGNKRGDALNFVTMVHAFCNENINVKNSDDGKLTFKLEKLAEANSFDSSNSHEAIADVVVTMQLFELLKKKNEDLFSVFKNNSISKNVEEKLIKSDLITYHNYMFSSHRIYLVKNIIKHPVYKNQYIGFDLKYDVDDLVELEESELKEIYKNKSFFRKIRLNKQPNILDKSFALKIKPYSDFSEDEIIKKCKNLENPNFIKNLTNILEKESIDLIDNQSQEDKLEEETIYTKNINYKDSMIMSDFHKHSWEEKWYFAEKFLDNRLKYFAAKHIFRNSPDSLPKKIFNYLHGKISEKLLSLEKQKFVTIPSAMQEADDISLEIEEEEFSSNIKDQLDQYNIYINFLNDYYSQKNPKPIRFDSILSKKLFG
ncbi:MAG: hypothetical protein CL572_01335 [Alphaproteobacteria bacterium]|nr:hypothetical protein [Alphaproteobacteria bacterium]